MKTPTSDELLAFLKADGGWEPARETKHGFYEKTLGDGTLLSTHVSWGKKKTVSPDTFKLILASQLGVTEDEFWDTIRREKPQRKATVLAKPKDDPLTLALRRELMRRLHYTDEQMIGMTGSQAKRLLKEFHESR